MAIDSPLDALIRRARAAETPDPRARAAVRSGLAQRLLADNPADRALEAALHAPEPGPLGPRPLFWSLPIAGLGLVAVALALRATPSPTPQPPAAAAAAAAAPAPAPAAPAPAAAAPAPAAAAPAPAPAAPAPAPRSPRSPSSSSSSAPSSSALLAESQALARVQRALRDGDPPRALALLAEQEREFASGKLVEERAAARAIALCSSGSSAGRSAAAAFVQRYPGSLLAARVHASCSASAPQLEPPAKALP